MSVRDCHYSRKKSTRQYLPPELSVAKLYEMWLEKDGPGLTRIPSLSFFRNIFQTKFNIGFGTPATDRCSACSLFEKQLGNPDANNFQEINAQFTLHKLKAATFHSLMSQNRNVIR